MVADNGNFFSISITPDDRWPASAFSDIADVGVGITNFEVIQTTGPTEGPRSPGAPTVYAGPGQTLPIYQAAQLDASVVYSNPLPVIQWKLYSGPCTVEFGNAAQTNTTATFSAPGVYTLELSADDGVHAVAYDTVVIVVTNAISLAITPAGTNVNLTWAGGSPPFVGQQADALPATAWTGLLTTSVQSVSIPITRAKNFLRVQGE